MNTEAFAELSAALLKANINIPISRIELIFEEFVLLKAQIDLINNIEYKPEPSNVFNVALRNKTNE